MAYYCFLCLSDLPACFNVVVITGVGLNKYNIQLVSHMERGLSSLMEVCLEEETIKKAKAKHFIWSDFHTEVRLSTELSRAVSRPGCCHLRQ